MVKHSKLSIKVTLEEMGGIRSTRVILECILDTQRILLYTTDNVVVNVVSSLFNVLGVLHEGYAERCS